MPRLLDCLFTSPGERKRRVRELICAGYLDRRSSPISDEIQILRLTRSGILEVEGDYPYRIHQKRQLSPAIFTHDCKLLEARLQIEARWNGTWTPESRLAQEDRDIPDGIFTFASGKAVYLELENSLKSRKRFLRRLKKFQEPILTLYITTKPEITRALQKYLASDSDIPPAAVLPLEFGEAPKAWTPSGPIYPFKNREV